jgi:hypothetical protein
LSCRIKHKKEKEYGRGIPSNDELLNYKDVEKKHILVIINFLTNRQSPFKVNFGKELFEKLDLVSLQKEYNLPIIFKLKSRADENGFEHNVKYLKGVLPDNLNYRILVDVKNDNIIPYSVEDEREEKLNKILNG